MNEVHFRSCSEAPKRKVYRKSLIIRKTMNGDRAVIQGIQIEKDQQRPIKSEISMTICNILH